MTRRISRLCCSTLVLLLLACLPGPLQAQDLPAYRWYTSTGGKADFGKVIKAARQADVVFFGELHNSAVAHWLQYELLRALIADPGAPKRPVLLGLEMFEADQQPALDAYLAQTLDDDAFAKATRFWPNYSTDYAPAVQLARLNYCRVWATNVPRPFAKAVSQGGVGALDTLSAANRAFAVPLPFDIDFTLPQYVAMGSMFGKTDHGANYVAAQALKDATMAHFIGKALTAQPGGLLLHLNGSYHSDRYEGIVWYLRRAQPKLRILTISTVEQNTLQPLDKTAQGLADFILVVPNQALHTY